MRLRREELKIFIKYTATRLRQLTSKSTFNIGKTMNRIFVLSDLHNRAEIESVIVPEAADAIVLAGDIVHAEIAFEHFAGFGKPVIVVLGNHDFDGMDILDGVDAMRDVASQYDNVYVLNNEALIINGVRFIGSTFWVSYGDLHPRLVVECNEYLTDSYKIQAVKWLADEGNRASIEFMAAQMAAEARRRYRGICQMRAGSLSVDDFIRLSVTSCTRLLSSLYQMSSPNRLMAKPSW